MLIESLKHDWSTIKRKEEIEILKQYTNIGYIIIISVISKQSFYNALEYAKRYDLCYIEFYSNFSLLLESKTNLPVIQVSCYISLSCKFYQSLIYPHINLYMI